MSTRREIVSGFYAGCDEDGRLKRENLRVAGKDERWLQNELTRRGCGGVRQVYVMILFGSGAVYFAEKE